MTRYPKPRDPKTDFASLLTMARNIGIRFHEEERIIFRTVNIKITDKQKWVFDEMKKWGFRIQLEMPFDRLLARKNKQHTEYQPKFR